MVLDDLLILSDHGVKEALVFLQRGAGHGTIYATDFDGAICGLLNHFSVPGRVFGMAADASTLERDMFVIADDTSVFVVKGSQVEGPLQELPAANDVTDPHGDRSFTDVPQLVNGGLRRGKVVVPVCDVSMLCEVTTGGYLLV